MSYGSALLAGGVGIAGGVVGALTLGAITDDFAGLYVGFALGQGMVTATAGSSLLR